METLSRAEEEEVCISTMESLDSLWALVVVVGVALMEVSCLTSFGF